METIDKRVSYINLSLQVIISINKLYNVSQARDLNMFCYDHNDERLKRNKI